MGGKGGGGGWGWSKEGERSFLLLSFTARNGVFPLTETFRFQKGNLCFRPGKLVFPSTETSRFHTFPSFRQRGKRTTFTRV